MPHRILQPFIRIARLTVSGPDPSTAGLERDLAEIDRRIAEARPRPNGSGDRALADALVARNAILCLLDRLDEAYAVQEEPISLAAHSTDPAVRARAREFAELMDGAPKRS